MTIPFTAQVEALLPAHLELRLHYIQTPPRVGTALFAAHPPGTDPDRTVHQSHFLSASIRLDRIHAHAQAVGPDVNGDAIADAASQTNADANHVHADCSEYVGEKTVGEKTVDICNAEVQVFALEVLSYETATLTTLFVSKADSTGYLGLAHAGKAPPSQSPTQVIITAFLEYLVQQKREAHRRLLLCLFARSQNQYLFPGSVDNAAKHVLDDRGLIKWWCRIFDRVIQNPEHGTYSSPAGNINISTAEHVAPLTSEAQSISPAHAHLLVPGCDAYETRSFLPRTGTGQIPSYWQLSDPLQSLRNDNATAMPPLRALIPRFPDDPKARFALDLDDELPDPDTEAFRVHPGHWRSVHSLAQFWELMAFRQECAAGRLVGFLWAVWEPRQTASNEQASSASVTGGQASSASVTGKHPPSVSATGGHLPPEENETKANTLSAVVEKSNDAGQTKSITASNTALDSATLTQKHFTKQEAGHLSCTECYAATLPSTRIPTDAYEKVLQRLDTLDYATLDAAKASTRTFLDMIAKEADALLVPVVVRGCFSPKKAINDGSGSDVAKASSSVGQDGARTLSTGLLRKKKRAPSESEGGSAANITDGASAPPMAYAATPTVLSGSLVRKKAKK